MSYEIFLTSTALKAATWFSDSSQPSCLPGCRWSMWWWGSQSAALV